MSVTQFPPKAVASVQFVDAAAANTIYQQAINLSAGVYTVSCVNTTNTTVDFWAGDNSLITSVTTASGTVTAALTSACARITYFTNTGSNIRIGLQLSGVVVGSGTTGTLDTITASGTYTPAAPGVARVCLIGGGGGGGDGTVSSPFNHGAGGGGSGYATIATLQLTGAGIAVTLGAGAAANGTGGTTTFGALSATGGSPGSGPTGGNGGSGGGAGTGSTGSGNPGAGGANGASGASTPSFSGGTGTGVSVATFVASTGGTAYGGGGGIYGGGGGGATSGNYGGGGGGGGVAGSGSSGRIGGAGGAGRVFVLRWAL